MNKHICFIYLALILVSVYLVIISKKFVENDSCWQSTVTILQAHDAQLKDLQRRGYNNSNKSFSQYPNLCLTTNPTCITFQT